MSDPTPAFYARHYALHTVHRFCADIADRWRAAAPEADEGPERDYAEAAAAEYARLADRLAASPGFTIPTERTDA